MSEIAIRIQNVSKKFRIHTERNQTLKEKFLYARRVKYQEFVALDDVSINIEKGSTVGLIGVNGSGKSTLLKLVSKIIYPDKGRIESYGRVSSLLELGAGFHPDFTGRENIFMNGALLGLTKKDIVSKLDEIIDFSELGDFIEQPVRSYSSGMYMRLAFSVAVAIDPEILLVDEILAVGDAAFQAKCMNRIKTLQKKGKTIVIVTHDTSSVEKFCDEAIWLHKGKIKMQGEIVPIIQAYLDNSFRSSREGNSIMNTNTNDLKVNGIITGNHDKVTELGISNEPDETRWGSRVIEISSVYIDEDGKESIVNMGNSMTIYIGFHAKQMYPNVIFGIGIFNDRGIQVYGTNTMLDRTGVRRIKQGIGKVEFQIDKCNIIQGNYSVDVAIHSEEGEPYDYWRNCTRFIVISDMNELGIARLDHAWSFVDNH